MKCSKGFREIMTPIYFPFTYVSGQAAKLLNTCFDKTIIYQPSAQNIPGSMKDMEEKGGLEIRIPAENREEELAGIIREYKNWAQVHQGTGMSFFKTQTDTIPFYDEVSVHRLRSDIKKKQKNEAAGQKTDPLLQSRIFLSMAQEFDSDHWDVSNGLKSYEKMEKALIEGVKGVKEFDNLGLTPHRSVTKDEPGQHMTDQRLKSWTSLLMNDPEYSGFFVTTSKYVIETLADISQDMEIVFREAIPGDPDSGQWKKDLITKLEKLTHNSEQVKDIESYPADTESGILTVYRSFSSPNDFFNPYVIKDLSCKNNKMPESKNKCTLIALLEIE